MDPLEQKQLYERMLEKFGSNAKKKAEINDLINNEVTMEAKRSEKKQKLLLKELTQPEKAWFEK